MCVSVCGTYMRIPDTFVRFIMTPYPQCHVQISHSFWSAFIHINAFINIQIHIKRMAHSGSRIYSHFTSYQTHKNEIVMKRSGRRKKKYNNISAQTSTLIIGWLARTRARFLERFHILWLSAKRRVCLCGQFMWCRIKWLNVKGDLYYNYYNDYNTSITNDKKATANGEQEMWKCVCEREKSIHI